MGLEIFKKKILGFIIISLLLIPIILADFGYNNIDRRSETIVNTFTGNLTQFISLTDTPGSYTGQGGLCVKVGAGETALEFGACGTGTLDGNASSICALGEYLDGGGNCIDLNATIDDRASGLGDNESWNESLANTLYADISVVDTNETTRMINILGTDCDAGNYSYGFDSDGNIQCRDDLQGSGDVINNTAGWILNFTDIFSIDWSNITITESQIKDLAHTTDTNETSFVRNLTDSSCAGKVVVGVQTNGSLICEEDDTGTGGKKTSDADLYLYNDSSVIYFNESNLNKTITTRINSSELEAQTDNKIGILDSFIDSLIDSRVTQAFVKTLGFYDKSEVYNKTETYNKGEIDSNLSNYILTADETDLNVNSSNYWDNLETINSTQMENSEGYLTILESWLSSFGNNLWCSLTGCTISGNLIAQNITANEYFFGKPFDGYLGSGIIWAEEVNEAGNLNVTATGGLGVDYPSFIMRLAKTDNTIKYCNISSGNVNIPDNTHSVYYIDNDCNIQNTAIQNYIETSLSPGGIADFFNVVSHSGNVEILEGNGLKNKEEIKIRKNSIKSQSLNVVSGMGLVQEGFPNITIYSGEYTYINEIFTTTKQNNSVGDTIELLYRQGGNWQYSEQTGLNITWCDDGTNSAECTNPLKYRRYYIGLLGRNDSTDTTQLHQVAASETEYYNNLGACLDISENPIIFDLPSNYEYAFVLLYAYCDQASSSAWKSGFIDLRTTKTEIATGTPDLSIFLTRDGARKLTDNWDVGEFNITNISNLNTKFYCNLTNCYVLEQFLEDTDTTYTNGSGISLTGTEFNHTDTSSQSSEDNSGNTFIQDIVLDTFGHITSIVSTAVDFSSYVAIADLVGMVGNWSADKPDYYTKTETDNNFSLYLPLTDQRFNETDLINSVNSTANIQNLINSTNALYTNVNVTGNLSIGGTILYYNGSDYIWT